MRRASSRRELRGDRWLLFVAVLVTGAAWGLERRCYQPAFSWAETGRKAETMIAVIPESSSMVLRATHIVVIALESAQPGQTESKTDSPVMAHSVGVTVRLEQNLKGVTRERPGETAGVVLTQYTSRITRRFSIPGMWSGQELKPGARFIVFSVTKKRNGLADILPDPACQQVLPAENALADVSVAVKSESDQLSKADVVALAQRFAPRLGQVFSEYLSAKLTDSSLPDSITFDRAMSLIETPNLSPIARTTLLDELSSKVMASTRAPDEDVNRLAVGMFRLLGMPQAENLHEQIIDPLLPNLVGITGGARKRDAGSVFVKFPSDRPRAEQALKHFRGEASTMPLLAWLKGEPQKSATPR